MARGDGSDDEEAQSLLSSSSLDAIARSKRQIAETAQLGVEVLRSLQDDAERVRSARGKQERIQQGYKEAENALLSIERSKLVEIIIVCFVLSFVGLGILFVLLKTLVMR